MSVPLVSDWIKMKSICIILAKYKMFYLSGNFCRFSLYWGRLLQETMWSFHYQKVSNYNMRLISLDRRCTNLVHKQV